YDELLARRQLPQEGNRPTRDLAGLTAEEGVLGRRPRGAGDRGAGAQGNAPAGRAGASEVARRREPADRARGQIRTAREAEGCEAGPGLGMAPRGTGAELLRG